MPRRLVAPPEALVVSSLETPLGNTRKSPLTGAALPAQFALVVQAPEAEPSQVLVPAAQANWETTVMTANIKVRMCMVGNGFGIHAFVAPFLIA